jgi:hypothetical protein
VSGRLYADLSRVSQGEVVVLFLADIPDQARVLTMYGSLKMGFRDASGNEIPLKIVNEPPAQPTPSLAGPRDGDTISLGEINDRGFIDVTYTVPDGQRLDEPTILDFQPEFTLAITGGVRRLCVLDGNQPDAGRRGDEHALMGPGQGEQRSIGGHHCVEGPGRPSTRPANVGCAPTPRPSATPDHLDELHRRGPAARQDRGSGVVT